MKRFFLLSAFFVLAVSAAPASAQMDFVGARFSMRATEVQHINMEAMNPDGDDSSVIVNPRPADMTYSPSKTRTQINLKNFVEKSRAASPAGAAELEQLFSSTDVVGEIGENLRGMGLNPHNVADAFAVYWINAWSVSSGDLSPTSPQTAKAVAAQVARGLAQSSDFASATDAQKQEMAEAMMVQAAMIASMAGQADGDSKQLKAVGNAVRQGAAASGLQLDRMTLTEAGFVPAKNIKGADASDAASGDDTRLASNNGGEGKGDTNYALIAAAAGAGLGGVFLLGKAMGRKA